MSKGKTVSAQRLDPQQMAMYQGLYGAAKGVAEQPFVPYTGARVAGFTPDQLRAFGATRGMFERAQEFDPMGRLGELAEARAPSLLDVDIGAYQSPFTSQVIEQSMQDIQRQADIARGGAQARAIGAGAFGGSRSALLESEAQRPYAEAMARTAAGLREAGFGRAQRAAESDIEREMANRRRQAELQRGLLGEQYRGLGLLGGIGGQQQMLQQRARDAAYQEFLRGIQYGPERVGILSQGVSGMPAAMTQESRKKTGAGDVLGTGAQLAAMMMMMSDERLKDNIKLISKEKGYNIYSWTWNKVAKKLGINSPTTGVLAQEVMKINPDAVSVNDNGYYMVNYGAL
jgi:hypothetical protein|tara:strand:- start:6092 stop:7123 length:1032 start_codon:yes stop_codon:yes gene_type:complete